MLRYLLILVALVNVTANANNSLSSADKIIKGVVIDSASTAALPFANITLHNNSDSSYVTGVSTNEEGVFTLSNVSDGNYYLKISFVGYNTKYLNSISLNDSKPQLDLGRIILTKTAYELSGAEVVGEKVSEELHLDKKL